MRATREVPAEARGSPCPDDSAPRFHRAPWGPSPVKDARQPPPDRREGTPRNSASTGLH